MKINKEFETLLSPLTEEEFSQLESNILKEGIKEPLQVWQDTLVDGHNRYVIATKHNLPYKTIDLNFADEYAVKEWIIANQMGRRNITEEQKEYLRGMRYSCEKQKEKQRNEDGTFSPGEQNVPQAKTAERLAKEYGVSHITIKRDEKFADGVNAIAAINPELKTKILQGKSDLTKQQVQDIGNTKDLLTQPMTEEEILSKAKEIKKVRAEVKKEEVKEKLNNIAAIKAKEIEGVYDVIVIDPPWQMEKIERDVAPNQVGFDYPTMNYEELKKLSIPAADDCHIFVWTTHKHLPEALSLINDWGFKYTCCFVWHKNGGFQPFNLPQFNCEFCLYCRKGSPTFIDTKSFNVCFNAERAGHSVKPDEFYATLARTTGGRRLDMFNRRAITGFDTWGNQANGL
jgi:N6-adenosine-specific RNA methylase IME4